ncbi:hypothetical protein ET464_10935 [Paenibacillus protaetiae]|uniref:Uncharacterized protein n=2 Tax=Paenibacillus protaetiae TaxID=2509456 RepID=A0A4V0YF85_9BACL|nr:hypothetical protein ET464_10935 [Paenibacillus protaetiae]
MPAPAVSGFNKLRLMLPAPAARRKHPHASAEHPAGGTSGYEGGENMRNILITVMMIVVVVLLFNSVIAADSTGTQARIKEQGSNANTRIGELLEDDDK